MLNLHFLNVGHGDSIIVEFVSADGPVYGVVDSCKKREASGDVNVALNKLKQLGATNLSFVALTHPHADHYGGLSEILEEFQGRVSTFFSYPIDQEKNRLRRLVENYKKHLDNTDSVRVSAQIVEFISILKWAKTCPVWESKSGRKSLMVADGFDALSLNSVMPPDAVKGKYFTDIDKGILSIEDEKANDLSLAIEIIYADKVIILGGDATHTNWKYQQSRLVFPKATIAKIPHHGSKHDCTSEVLDTLFGKAGAANAPIAVISAEGSRHRPHENVLKGLYERGVRPYCTNLSSLCAGPRLRVLKTNPDLDPVLNRFINASSEESGTPKSPCQGDITVSIAQDGAVSVARQFSVACAYRNELSF